MHGDYNDNQELNDGTNKTMKKIAKHMMHLAKLAIRPLFLFFMPFLLIIILGLFGYFILFEFKGSELQYTDFFANETVFDDSRNIQVTKKDMMNVENQTIRDFYKYFAGQGYVQIYEKDGEMELIRRDHPEAVKDFYNRENEFTLNENILFVLDQRMYDDWKYPEQFIKPVKFNKDTLELENLTDDEGEVIAKSVERYVSSGRPIPKNKGSNIKYNRFNIDQFKTIDSVRDYGLATVLKYQEGERNLTVEGTYVSKDVYDPEKKRIIQVPINENFEYQLEGFKKEKVHVIEKAITFVGEIDYEYENLKNRHQALRHGESRNPKEPVTKIMYDVYTEEIIDEKTGEVKEVIEHPLYKYRSDESGIFEEVPTLVNSKTKEKGDRYFKDYILNFEAYIPEDVLTDFEFKDRIDYDSSVFDVELAMLDNYAMDLGSKANSQNIVRAMRWKDEFMYYGKMFGVDPYVLIAIASQESGGNPNINGDGLMQITSVHKDIVATDVNGNEVSFTIHDRTDPVASIQYAAMRMSNMLKKHDNNIYKAIQEYNFGVGTMNTLKKVSGTAWDSEFGWLIFREQARRVHAPMGKNGQKKASASYGCMAFPEGKLENVRGNLFGDSCYLENVLRYYVGGDIEKLESEGFWDKLKGFGSSLISKFNEFLKIDGEREDPIPMKNYIGNRRNDEPETIVKFINAYDDNELFSETETDTILNDKISIFSQDFMHIMSGGGSSSFASMDEILNVAPNPNGYTPPVDMKYGRITSEFGPRVRPNAKASAYHKGIDVGLPIGTPLYAIADGTVVHAGSYGTGGLAVKIKHDNGTMAVYMHMNSIAVRKNDRVTQRQPIGQSGNTGNSTGPHLHFEFHINNKPVNPKPILLGK